jgi:hypothetical protein
MPSPSTRRFRLKAFFWTALVFNLAEYIAVALFFARTVRLSNVVGSGILGLLILFLFLLILPALLIQQAIFLLNNYYPEEEMSRGLRGFIVSLCVLQILSSLFFAILGFAGATAEMPRQPGEFTDDLALQRFLMALAMFVASLWNLATAVVCWRTVWVIRKNHRKTVWESFEAG